MMPMIPLVLTVARTWFSDNSTIGEMYVGLEKICYTLEDTVRDNGVKIYGKTAIPTGRYEVVMNYSNRFQRFLPLLLNVPDFEGVRIHTGNRPEDTEGCILVGKTKNDDQPNYIFESRAAFNDLMAKIEPSFKTTKIYLEITGSRNPVNRETLDMAS
jgi:hypothetical protein